MIDEIATPAIVGAIASPEFVADTPKTACRKSGRKMVATNMAADIANPMAAATADPPLGRGERQPEVGGDDHHGRQADREVDPEDPPP
jgi:hypothetical protein